MQHSPMVISMTENSFFVERMCEEGITLAVEARNYIAYHEKRYRQNYSLPTCLRIGYQLTRVTARILQSMSWLLTYRAIAEGELPSEQLTSPEFALKPSSECEENSGLDMSELPSGVKSLLERSHHFYMRVSRLDTMCRRPQPRRKVHIAAVSSVPMLRIVGGEPEAAPIMNVRLMAE